ncbi:hypothetical protein HanIR_Chr06g0258921 [Helianthus annuus]|nr:hypothetical protein HanIR_Chr06g0258921 [Helianthus annuus]
MLKIIVFITQTCQVGLLFDVAGLICWAYEMYGLSHGSRCVYMSVTFGLSCCNRVEEVGKYEGLYVNSEGLRSSLAQLVDLSVTFKMAGIKEESLDCSEDYPSSMLRIILPILSVMHIIYLLAYIQAIGSDR